MYKLLVLLLIPIISNGQIKESPAKTDDTKIIDIGEFIDGSRTAKLEYFVIGKDSAIYLNYQNQEYTAISDRHSITFKGGNAEKNQLYNILKSVLESENPDILKEFELGKTKVTVKKNKLGDKIFFFTKEGYFTLDKFNLLNLFGL